MTADDILDHLEAYPPLLGSGNPILTGIEYDGKELYSVDKENLEQKLKDEFEDSEYKETEAARMEWQAENEPSVLIEGYK